MLGPKNTSELFSWAEGDGLQDSQGGTRTQWIEDQESGTAPYEEPNDPNPTLGLPASPRQPSERKEGGAQIHHTAGPLSDSVLRQLPQSHPLPDPFFAQAMSYPISAPSSPAGGSAAGQYEPAAALSPSLGYVRRAAARTPQTPPTYANTTKVQSSPTSSVSTPQKIPAPPHAPSVPLGSVVHMEASARNRQAHPTAVHQAVSVPSVVPTNSTSAWPPFYPSASQGMGVTGESLATMLAASAASQARIMPQGQVQQGQGVSGSYGAGKPSYGAGQLFGSWMATSGISGGPPSGQPGPAEVYKGHVRMESMEGMGAFGRRGGVGGGSSNLEPFLGGGEKGESFAESGAEAGGGAIRLHVGCSAGSSAEGAKEQSDDTRKRPSLKRKAESESKARQGAGTAVPTNILHIESVSGCINPAVTIPDPKLCDEWDCYLTQNLNPKNPKQNKVYMMQIVQQGTTDDYFVFSRWGQYGEQGAAQYRETGPMSLRDAADMFCNRFKERTKVEWAQRTHQKNGKGKYRIKYCSVLEKVLPSPYPGGTLELLKMIVSTDTVMQALRDVSVDTSKLSLQALQYYQLVDAASILEALEGHVLMRQLGVANVEKEIKELCAKFRSIVPQIPMEGLTVAFFDDLKSLELMTQQVVLLSEAQVVATVPPIVSDDEETRAAALGVKLRNVDRKADKRVRDAINMFFEATKGAALSKHSLADLWFVDREAEIAQYNKHAEAQDRRLLWHAATPSSLASVLKLGAQAPIVATKESAYAGRGIYLAPEASRSFKRLPSQYQPLETQAELFAFVCEAVLDPFREIVQEDPYQIRLAGSAGDFGSIYARGKAECTLDYQAKIQIDGRTVTFPVGSPMPTYFRSQTQFPQPEFVIFDPSRVRVRLLARIATE